MEIQLWHAYRGSIREAFILGWHRSVGLPSTFSWYLDVSSNCRCSFRALANPPPPQGWRQRATCSTCTGHWWSGKQHYLLANTQRSAAVLRRHRAPGYSPWLLTWPSIHLGSPAPDWDIELNNLCQCWMLRTYEVNKNKMRHLAGKDKLSLNLYAFSLLLINNFVLTL